MDADNGIRWLTCFATRCRIPGTQDLHPARRLPVINFLAACPSCGFASKWTNFADRGANMAQHYATSDHRPAQYPLKQETSNAQ
jgi:hypothetical protein